MSSQPLDCILHKRKDQTEYLLDVLTFLEEYRWVYDFKLTDFILNRQWQHIPAEWVDVLTNLNTEELNNLPYHCVESTWPVSLLRFLHQSQAFSLDRKASTDVKAVPLSKNTCRGMTPKKQHEVSRLAALVAKTCLRAEAQLVVDVGAGLGYLGQVLSQHFSLNILGLECEESRTHGAEKRATKHEAGSSDMESITFKLLDSEKSLQEFQSLLACHLDKIHRLIGTDRGSCSSKPQCTTNTGQNGLMDSGCHNRELTQETIKFDHTSLAEGNNHLDKSLLCDGAAEAMVRLATSDCDVPSSSGVPVPSLSDNHLCEKDLSSPGVCLVGLHCCGSLTPTMLKVATQLPEVKALVCVSCCYHAMVFEDGLCADFPLSQALGKVLHDTEELHSWNISAYALRLAAQETRVRWQGQTAADHEAHTRNVAYRAVLEAWAHEQGQQVLKERRRLVTQKNCRDFPGYVEAVLERTTLSGDEGACKRLMEIYADYQAIFKLIEPFTALQVCLQPVLESLIIKDRLLYIEEQGLTPQAIPVFDEMISPRNMAIVVVKEPR